MRAATADPRAEAIHVRTLSASGVWSFAKTIATTRRPGSALVVWTERSAGENHEGTGIRAGLVAADGTYGGPEIVTRSDAWEAAVAIDPVSGRATVLWSEFVDERPSRNDLRVAQRALP